MIRIDKAQQDRLDAFYAPLIREIEEAGVFLEVAAEGGRLIAKAPISPELHASTKLIMLCGAVAQILAEEELPEPMEKLGRFRTAMALINDEWSRYEDGR